MTATEVAVPKRSGRRKALLRALLLLVVGLVGLAVLGIMGTLLSSVTQSGNAAAVFTDAAELPEDLVKAVTWLPDVEDIPRPMEPLTRADVTSAWIRAWSQLTIAAETGDTSGMEVYFSNSALEGVLANAESSFRRPVFQIAHDLQLTFYSEDGQVIGLTAVKSRMLRAEPFDDGIRRFFEAEESYEAVLILEDGNWRIQHWVRQSVEGDWLVGGSLQATSEVVREAEAGPAIADVRILGLSAATPQGHAGSDPTELKPPDRAAIEVAIDAVEDKDAVLRVPIGFDELGGANPNTQMLVGIDLLLEIAAEKERMVVLSLFEGRVDFRPSLWDADRRHLDGIRAALGGHRALVSLELKNLALGTTPLDADLADAWTVSMARPSRVETPVVAVSSEATPLSVGGPEH